MANAYTRPKAGPSPPLRRVVCRAYAIRPYTGTRKRTTVYAYHNRETIKRTTFSTSHPMVYPERGTFFIFHNRETIQRAAFYVFHRMIAHTTTALGYIAIVERLMHTAFHAFHGMA